MRADYRVLGPLKALPARLLRPNFFVPADLRGRHEEVVVTWQRAIDLRRDLGDERAEELARRLAELGQEPGRRRGGAGVDRDGAGLQRPPG